MSSLENIATENPVENNHNINFELSVAVFAVFMIALLWKLYYFLKHRNDPLPRSPTNPEMDKHANSSTQDVIKRLLVLKTVVRIPNNHNLGQGSMELGVIRMKSNLQLFDGDESGQRTCAICLGDYEDGDQICWSNNQDCLHHFHSTCGVAWLTKHSQCPICRAEYLVEAKPLGQQGSREKENEMEHPIQLNVEEQGDELQGRANANSNQEVLPDENV